MRVVAGACNPPPVSMKQNESKTRTADHVPPRSASTANGATDVTRRFGSSTARRPCPQCGHSNATAANACQRCGTQLTRSAADTPHPHDFFAELSRLLLLSGLTVLAFSLIFPPRPWWPLAFVCLVPWTVAVCRTSRTWLLYWVSFATGWIFYLINLYWLIPVTGLGYAALAFYLALYWPLAAWAIRTVTPTSL